LVVDFEWRLDSHLCCLLLISTPSAVERDPTSVKCGGQSRGNARHLCLLKKSERAKSLEFLDSPQYRPHAYVDAIARVAACTPIP
jgi:hypothetical protein